MGVAMHKRARRKRAPRFGTAIALGRRRPTKLGADPRNPTPCGRAPLSASSYGGQSDGRLSCARREATDNGTVVKDLVRNRWVSRRRSVKDDRVVVLSLSRRADTLALQIEQRVQQFSITLAEQNRKALSMVQKGSRDSPLRLSFQPS